MIYGYKCFNKGMTNRYGMQFQVENNYHMNGEISFGNDGNGFHMCIRLEDTLRFFDAFRDEVDICEVVGFGKYIKRDDEYNGYYDMYVCENIYVIKKLTREEIISYGLNLDEVTVPRFIASYKLTGIEKQLFKDRFKDHPSVIKYIDYYQDNIKTAFINEQDIKILKRENNML